jgi:hypothetical protein
MLTGLGDKSPAEAAQLALDLLNPGKKQDDAIVTITQHWVQSEPEIVASWVMQFPTGDLQTTAIDSFVPIWADKDFKQVSDWVRDLPPGAFRDTVIRAFVPKVLVVSPQSAAPLIAGMTDPVLRQQQMEFLAKSQTGK